MSVDVILLAFENPEKTTKAIAGVQASVYPDIHLILFDNGSTKSQLPLLDTYTRPWTHVNPGQKLSFARANNLGAKEGKADHILLLNNDCYMSPTCLSALVDCMQDDPKAAVVSARLLYPHGGIQDAGVIFDRNLFPHHRYNRFPSDHPLCLMAEKVPSVTASCTLYRRDVWEELGGLDEIYYPISAEDTDYCVRARVAGYNVWYEGAAVAIHEEWGSANTPGAHNRREADARNTRIFQERWSKLYSDLNTLTPR